MSRHTTNEIYISSHSKVIAEQTNTQRELKHYVRSYLSDKMQLNLESIRITFDFSVKPDHFMGGHQHLGNLSFQRVKIKCGK